MKTRTEKINQIIDLAAWAGRIEPDPDGITPQTKEELEEIMREIYKIASSIIKE